MSYEVMYIREIVMALRNGQLRLICACRLLSLNSFCCNVGFILTPVYNFS
jgi:hypothetical protein